MAIQNRRGVYSDFTPSKMVPGELAVVQSGDPNNTSGKAVYAAFGASGDVKRLATEDDLDTIDSDLNDKVDKETGKGLSTNDYTTAEKNKLSGIATGAEVNVQSDWNQANSSADDFIKNKPTKTSDFTNDGDGTSNFATESYVQLNGGKIDTISVNGTQQTITNKNVDIPVPVIDSTLAQTGKAADAKVVGDELADVRSDLSEKASVIISSASGLIAHFEDGSESDAVDVVAHINPVQDLHGYDNPWPAGGGKNLFDKDAASIGYRINTNGTLYEDADYYASDYIPVVVGSSYTKNSPAADAYHRFAVYDVNKSFVRIPQNSAQTVTIESGEAYIRFCGLQTELSSSQLELGSTATSFAPYSNICPISGFTGMNVSVEGANICSFTNEQKYIDENGNLVDASAWRLTDYIIVEKPFMYKGLSTVGNAPYSAWYDSGKNLISTFKQAVGTNTTAPPNGATYVRFSVYYSDVETFMAYTGQTYLITFPSEAGTVYGGYVDPVKEKLVVDRGYVVYVGSSDESWSYYSVTQGNLFRITISEMENFNPDHIMCSMFKPVLQTNRANGTVSGGVTSKNLDFIYNSVDDLNGWKLWLSQNPVGVVYKLSTPITYDITSQQIALLYGVNNIWHDANGDTDVEYKADTKLYIEQLTKPTEDDMVANTAITSGKFFMVGNRLFLSTSTIASGDTINPGTNCTELSLADALNSL